MSGILFSKNTNSTESSKDPSSKPKLPKIETPIEEDIPVRVSNRRPKQPTLQLDAHYPKVTYPCQLCPKIYTSIHALRGHQNAHKRDGLKPRVQEVDLKEHEGENDVKVNPERRCDHPQYRPRYRALRQRASNHNITNQPRRRPLRTRPTHQIPIHPNHNRGNQPSYVGPNRRVSNDFPPPTPTYDVTLVPTQVTVNECVPTTRRPPPPPLSAMPVVEAKFEFGNLQIDGAADANVADDACPNDDLDLDLKL